MLAGWRDDATADQGVSKEVPDIGQDILRYLRLHVISQVDTAPISLDVDTVVPPPPAYLPP